MEIVNLVKDTARRLIGVKSFMYGKTSQKGAGNTLYPCVWLDDPISINKTGGNVGGATYRLNIDILAMPEIIEDTQTQCLAYAYAIIHDLLAQKYTLGGWSILTLRDYYDDGAAGVRLSLSIDGVIDYSKCVQYFDDGKQLETLPGMADFGVLPEGCAVFATDNNALPKFEV